MKKSLLMILGAAALLAGCAKDLSPDLQKLEDRVAQLEKQVEANKKAIEELQKANFITAVEQTEAGWSVTLDDGKVLTLYNGKDGKDGKDGVDGKDGAAGKDGDSFFKSVEIVDGNVVFTLTDGTSFEIPFAEEFAIKLESRELVVEPNTQVEIPFTIVGKTADTEVYVLGSGAYEASIDGDKVIVKIPATITKNSVLLAADNGHGKTSIKSINFEEHSFTVGTPSGAAPFWGGNVTFKVTSNVDYTVTSSASWLEVVSTKAVTENTVTLKAGPTPCGYTRTAEVYVKDEYKNTVQTITVSQSGTKPVMVFNSGYDSFADAVAAVKDGKNADVTKNGYVDVAVSETQAPLEEIFAIPESDMKWVVRVRSYGGGKAENCVIRGIDVRNTELEVKDITIEPAVSNAGQRPLAKDGDTYGTTYFGYAYGMCVETDASKPITVKNVIFKVNDELVTYKNATLLYVCPSTGLVTLDGCQIDGRGSRISQIYGGNVKFNACNIANGYSSYAVRIGAANAHLVLTNNLIDTPKVVDIHSSIAATSTITFGENGVDNNHYSAKVTQKAVDPKKEGVTVTIGEAPEATVEMNGVMFTTVQEAVDFAENGAVITLGNAVYKENVKINKDVTIVGKSRSSSIIAGNIEIASKCTLKGFTVRSESGVTNKVCAYSNGYDWGYPYVLRIELGAKDVLVEDMDIRADVEDSNFSDMSTIWISEAENVTVRNSLITSNAKGGYCNNQTYVATNLVFEGNEFTGGGRKGWASRIAANTTAIFKANTFHTKYALDVYSTLTGSLTLGDGAVDDNIYGTEVEVALNGDKNALVAAGAKFFPEDMVFGQKSTTPSNAVWEKVWYSQIADLGINDSRGFAFWNGEVLCGVAAGDKGEGSPAPYISSYPMVTVSNGAVSKTLTTLTEGAGFTGWVTGVAVVDNAGKQDLIACGVVATGNKWAATNYEFYVYHFTSADKYEVAVHWTMPEAEAERMGDYLSFQGTWQDGKIMTCAANATSKHVYVFNVKDGVADQTPTKLTIADDVKADKSGTAGIYYLKDDLYMITNEAGLVGEKLLPPILVKIEGENVVLAGKMDVSGFALKAKGATVVRTPRLITLEGKDYLVFMAGEYGGATYGSANMGNINVCVLPLTGATLLESLTSYKMEDVKILPVANGAAYAGNGFAGVDADVFGNTCRIGYGVRGGELGVIKFRP